VDTDGSVFAVSKPRVKSYPSIEITTVSEILAKQLKHVLEKQRFRLTKIWSFLSKQSKRTCYGVALNGKDNLRKWIDEIGFSNPYKLDRAVSYLK